MKNPALERVAVFWSASNKLFASLKSSGDASVKEIELGGFDGLPGLSLAPYGDFARNEGVFEYFEILLHGASGNLRVRGNGLVVDLVAAGECRDFEEAAECREIPRRAFLHDFLLKIERDVSGEVFFGGVRKPYSWKKAIVYGAVKVESITKF